VTTIDTAGAILGPPRRLDFELPPERIADAPIEARGRMRDEGLLLVARRGAGTIEHLRMGDMPDVLRPGDLLVVNDSATLPAAVPATDGTLVHVAGEHPDGTWIVELRIPCAAGSHPLPDAAVGQVIALPGDARLRLIAPLTTSTDGVRLWHAAVDGVGSRLPWLQRHGRPIRYGCTSRRWPLAAYQTVFATVPGSSEMPSAARGFTRRLVRHLKRTGVELAAITLHTGVSSADAGERPQPERLRVADHTAAAVNAARNSRRRVIAVGTTVARALESAADGHGTVRPTGGWTDVVITPQRGVRVIDALLTGWHEPAASHLDLIEAVAGTATLERSYSAAITGDYLWHEFGDFHLILP
jgi:S-adenosylmethionine:tRNA ribosyltransferase-isomerase